MAVVRRHDDVFGVPGAAGVSSAASANAVHSVSDVVSDLSSAMSNNMAAVAVAVARENARRRIQQTSTQSDHLTTLSASSCSILALDHEQQQHQFDRDRDSLSSPFMLTDRHVDQFRLNDEDLVTFDVDDNIEDDDESAAAAPVTPSSFAAVTVPSTQSVDVDYGENADDTEKEEEEERLVAEGEEKYNVSSRSKGTHMYHKTRAKKRDVYVGGAGNQGYENENMRLKNTSKGRLKQAR